MTVTNPPANSNRLTNLIMLALIAGIAVGYVCNVTAPNADAAKNIASYFSIVTDIFLRMIKMIIAPLVFATIVSGIASLGKSGGSVGRIASKAMAWFITASLVSLGLGMLFANIFAPGRNLGLPLPAATAATNLQTAGLNLKDFLSHVFPTSIAQAMSSNEVLQILVFSIFFGFALSSFKNDLAKTITAGVEELVHVMLKITDYVMKFAPIEVAAIAAVITTQGIGVLATYAKFIGIVFTALTVLVDRLIMVGMAVLGRSALHLIAAARADADRFFDRQQRGGLSQDDRTVGEVRRQRTHHRLRPAPRVLLQPRRFDDVPGVARCSSPSLRHRTGRPASPPCRASLFGGHPAHVRSTGGRTAPDPGHRPPRHGPHHDQRHWQRPCHRGRRQVGRRTG